jgi:hypothetical protein
MPTETRGQAAVRSLSEVVEAVVPKKKEQQEGPTAAEATSGLEKRSERQARHGFWGSRWEATVLRKEGRGPAHKQLDLMINGSLEDRFKKLQKNVGTEPS